MKWFISFLGLSTLVAVFSDTSWPGMGERGCLFEENYFASNRANASSLANWQASNKRHRT